MEVESVAPQKPTRAPLACAGGCKVELPASKLLILLNDGDESWGSKDIVQKTNGNEGYEGFKLSC